MNAGEIRKFQAAAEKLLVLSTYCHGNGQLMAAHGRMAAVLYTLMTFFPNPANRPEAKDVLAKFQAEGIDPAGYTLYAYAATQILKQAIDKAGTPDTRKVAEMMHSGVPFKTVLGEIAFDRKGDIKQPGFVPYIWKNTGGRITYVELKLGA